MHGGKLCQGVGFRVKGFFSRALERSCKPSCFCGYKLRGMGTTLGLPNPSRLPLCLQGSLWVWGVWVCGIQALWARGSGFGGLLRKVWQNIRTLLAIVTNIHISYRHNDSYAQGGIFTVHLARPIPITAA